MEYDWQENMPTFTIPDSLKTEPKIFFKKHQIVEFGFEDEKFTQIEVLHKIFWVNSDEAIDRNNKVYLPIGKGTDLVSTKARVLNPDGNETLLNEDDVIELKDEDDNISYYYALKGIEIGSFIEFFYVVKTAPSYNGSRRGAQETAPIFNFQFELISPSHLIFETKSYNGYGDLDEDTFDEDHNHLSKTMEYVAKFEEEDQAYNFPNRMAVMYKLEENTVSGSTNMVNYKSVGKNMISAYTVGTKTDMKTFSKMMKEIEMDNVKTDEEKIVAWEKYFKGHFALFQANSADLTDLSFIYKNKVSNSPGFMKFMALACEKNDIDYRFVITCSRKLIDFDTKFQAYNFLQKYLMYFPKLDKYMDMEGKFSTLGYPGIDFQDNNGVFFKKIVVGDIISSTAKIKWISAPDAFASISDMNMKVKVADDFSTLEFDLKTTATGYNVSGTQPYFGLMTPESEKDLTEQLIKWVDEDMDLHEVKADNTGLDAYGKEPLIITGTFGIDKYIVSVKDKYLIKLGLFIGPQAEMYQDGKQRKFPVDMGFRKSYHRVFSFEIPEGYNLTNMESINMSVEAKEEDGTVYADFISTYVLDGNMLTVTCDERYHKIHYPIAQYEDYRRVINAAADFNKIVVYLEEK
jgi:hypothetical protein